MPPRKKKTVKEKAEAAAARLVAKAVAAKKAAEEKRDREENPHRYEWPSDWEGSDAERVSERVASDTDKVSEQVGSDTETVAIASDMEDLEHRSTTLGKEYVDNLNASPIQKVVENIAGHVAEGTRSLIIAILSPV